MSDPRRILVFQALQLGDFLCMVPALRALRAGYPKAEIVLLGLPWARDCQMRFRHYLDGFIEFPGAPGLPEREPDREGLVKLRERLRGEPFDLTLQMHGNGTFTNPLLISLGARRLAGYTVVDGAPRSASGPETSLIAFLEGEHVIRRHLRLVASLGLPSQGEHLEFPLEESDFGAIAELSARTALHSQEYICVHPGARHRGKCWPVEKFAQVADNLAARGHKIVLTGSAHEADLTAAVARAMAAPCVDTASFDLPLGALAALLKRARLVIVNDTGVSHLTAALEVPSVVIFSATDPAVWAPLNRNRHRALGGPGQSPDVAEVLAAVSGLLMAEYSKGDARMQDDSMLKRQPRIRVAPGELIDKITILEIKSERISDPEKLVNVRAELVHLQEVFESSVITTRELTSMTSDLKKINEALWEIEDEIRLCESRRDFGLHFIELARSVYQQNDRRALVKRRINDFLNSPLREEKSYQAQMTV